MQEDIEKLKEDNEEILVEYWEEKYGGNYNNGEGAEDALDRWLSYLEESEINQILSIKK